METDETKAQKERIFDAAIKLTAAAISGNHDLTHSIVRGFVNYERIASSMVDLAQQIAIKAME